MAIDSDLPLGPITAAAAPPTGSPPPAISTTANFRRLLEGLPREKVLLETDCPYLGPEKGELNEPANVAVTAGYAA